MIDLLIYFYISLCFKLGFVSRKLIILDFLERREYKWDFERREEEIIENENQLHEKYRHFYKNLLKSHEAAYSQKS